MGAGDGLKWRPLRGGEGGGSVRGCPLLHAASSCPRLSPSPKKGEPSPKAAWAPRFARAPGHAVVGARSGVLVEGSGRPSDTTRTLLALRRFSPDVLRPGGIKAKKYWSFKLLVSSGTLSKFVPGQRVW